MRRIIIHIMLFTFIFNSTCDLWIISSFYANREYISQNICINRFETIPICKGQCFLEKQLSESQKKDGKFPDLKIKEIQLFFEDAAYFCSKPPVFFIKYPKKGIISDFILLSYFLNDIFHPPKLV